MRALFEIALKRNWVQVTKLTLDYSNMIASRLWKAESPLRQFPNFPPQVARKLERKSDIEWSRYFDLPSQDLGELVGVPKLGKVLHKLVHQFPRLDLSAVVQPITHSLLRVDLTLTADFQIDVKVHGYIQLFHIIVEDVNGAVILHHELFILKSSSSEEEHVVLFFVPVLDPLPPQYFIRVFSDRWLHSKSVLPISFQHLILPANFLHPQSSWTCSPCP
jgi:pre-mRNA-splicing helicase BRR2